MTRRGPGNDKITDIWEGPGPHRHDQLSPISYAANVTTPDCRS
jgi:hypothetical protein